MVSKENVMALLSSLMAKASQSNTPQAKRNELLTQAESVINKRRELIGENTAETLMQDVVRLKSSAGESSTPSKDVKEDVLYAPREKSEMYDNDKHKPGGIKYPEEALPQGGPSDGRRGLLRISRDLETMYNPNHRELLRLARDVENIANSMSDPSEGESLSLTGAENAAKLGKNDTSFHDFHREYGKEFSETCGVCAHGNT
jgi:hypothetical protein